MKKRKTILIILVLALALTACGGANTTPEAAAPEAEAEPAAAENNVFIYAHNTGFPDLNPASSFSDDLLIMANCYETLTFYNTPGSEETLSPKLATAWESDADSMVWTFTLREGVTFQDGEPFNAEAVKAAIDNTIALEAGASYIWAPVETIEVVDEYTVQFNLMWPAPLDIIAAAGYAAWIYSPKAYAEKGHEWFNEGNCAGTGPYTIQSYERGSRIVMAQNENYWGEWSDNQYQTAVFQIVEDPVVRQQMIEAGTASFTHDVPADNLATLDARDDVVVYANPAFQNLVGLFNTQKEPLNDPLVRQAISYAFPYDQFMQGVIGERGTQSHGPIPAGIWGHSDDLFQYSYDLDKAKELLTEAGYPDGGFELVYTFATGDLDEQQAGELWKAELAKLGITLELRPMTWEAQWDLGMSGSENAQDIFAIYWWPDYVSPISWLYGMYHSEEETLFNLGYYNNPEFDELIDIADAISSTDREEATAMFIEAQEILVNDAVSLFLYDMRNTHLARTDVKGYVDNPAYPHVVFVYDLHK
ncbi:MAG: ABC transporter substrate-binding protein [Chloroflexi bacterium]|nr:ABC transporter substrate-binding protein [Chloroflexota bacterium]